MLLEAQVYHKIHKDSMPSILEEGLKYGAQRNNSRDDHARKTNEFLDKVCPRKLGNKGVDRTKCTYNYLCADGKIFDVESGLAIPQEQWGDEDNVKLRLAVDPGNAFISDLDLYDQLADRIDAHPPDNELTQLARQYWRHLVNLSDLRAYDHLEGDALVGTATLPPGLPARLHRVEVLLTTDVPSQDIERA